MTNAFTVATGHVVPGVTVSPPTDEERAQGWARPLVHVGEAGRGRALGRAPVPAGSVVEFTCPGPAFPYASCQERLAAPGLCPDCAARSAAPDVLASRQAEHLANAARRDGTLASVPARPGDPEGVVLRVMDHSGYRGGWSLAAWDDVVYAARLAAMAAHDAARATVTSCFAVADGHGDGYSGHIATCPHPTCRSRPEYPAFATVPGLRVIAEGYRADGIAGRMGGGPEYLLFAPVGTRLRLARGGRLYGAPAILRLEVRSATEVAVIDVEAEVSAKTAEARW